MYLRQTGNDAIDKCRQEGFLFKRCSSNVMKSLRKSISDRQERKENLDLNFSKRPESYIEPPIYWETATSFLLGNRSIVEFLQSSNLLRGLSMKQRWRFARSSSCNCLQWILISNISLRFHESSLKPGVESVCKWQCIVSIGENVEYVWIITLLQSNVGGKEKLPRVSPWLELVCIVKTRRKRSFTVGFVWIAHESLWKGIHWDSVSFFWNVDSWQRDCWIVHRILFRHSHHTWI